MKAVLYLDLAALEMKKERGAKIIAKCPACAENGGDGSGEHLVVFEDGRFACVKHAGDSVHRQRIFEMIGRVEHASVIVARPTPPKPKPAPKRVDLLAQIKADFPSALGDLWESSPVRCDAKLSDTEAFLKLFPSDAVLWIAPDIYRSGKPEHSQFFRTRKDWQRETITAAGTRIAPASFKPGSVSRNGESIAEHLFVVVETDDIGKGKRYADQDEFCCLIRWLREACSWHLAAVVDSGGKSLHAWFRHPGAVDVAQLAEHAQALGLDAKFSEPAQPWRLPGVRRENSERRQQLFYLNLEERP